MNVHHRERAAGVDPRLGQFLDWWEKFGPFQITVLSKGGLRTDSGEQAVLFQEGKSNARTLEETPHGRGGAIDVAPLLNGAVPWEDKNLFLEIGQIAEGHGLQWGGRWKRPAPVDGPHIQVPDWRSLPYPPQKQPSVA